MNNFDDDRFARIGFGWTEFCLGFLIGAALVGGGATVFAWRHAQAARMAEMAARQQAEAMAALQLANTATEETRRHLAQVSPTRTTFERAVSEIDQSPLPLRTTISFPRLQWEGWQFETDAGQPNPLRPIFLTHAGDGADRVFVIEQHGVVYVFPNDQAATQAKVFLDLRDRVAYDDDQNEEGLLGLAFHPKFKDNGELFVYYTPRSPKRTNVVSRFHLRKDDSTKADPTSEEPLVQIKKPFWNHDGGTLCFGPDGYLYFTHGDGGAANDPFDNGQNLNSWLGKIHRIDINRREPGRKYAIPQDNPFAGRPDVRPEIWAYGLRNVWRMAFDRNKLWAADVGQDLWEEINLITRGGNYGWNRREGRHPFGPRASEPKPEFIEPIWEYHHDVGKSITGGCVYRGSRVPELTGHYLYGDYVSCKLWALLYDDKQNCVTANRPIPDPNVPIFSFGQDERGEVYFLTATSDGRGIYWFTR